MGSLVGRSQREEEIGPHLRRSVSFGQKGFTENLLGWTQSAKTLIQTPHPISQVTDEMKIV